MAKDINKTNLSPLYLNIPYKDFENHMKSIGFDGDFDKAYEKLGGIVQAKKDKQAKK